MTVKELETCYKHILTNYSSEMNYATPAYKILQDLKLEIRRRKLRTPKHLKVARKMKEAQLACINHES